MNPVELKRLYAEVVKPSDPLMNQIFWLDAVSSGDWGVRVVTMNHADYLIPITETRYWWGRKASMPPWTDYLKPLKVNFHLIPGRSKMRIMEFYQYPMVYSAGWPHGFSAEEKSTFILASNNTSSNLLAGCSKSYRKTFRRHHSRFELVKLSSPLAIQDLIRMQIFVDSERSFAQLLKLCEVLLKQGQGDLYGLRERSTRQLRAFQLVGKDTERYYLICGGQNRDQLSRVVMPILYIKVLSQLIQTDRIIDFCGSDFAGVQAVFKALGAVQQPFYRFYKVEPALFWWGVQRLRKHYKMNHGR